MAMKLEDYGLLSVSLQTNDEIMFPSHDEQASTSRKRAASPIQTNLWQYEAKRRYQNAEFEEANFGFVDNQQTPIHNNGWSDQSWNNQEYTPHSLDVPIDYSMHQQHHIQSTPPQQYQGTQQIHQMNPQQQQQQSYQTNHHHQQIPSQTFPIQQQQYSGQHQQVPIQQQHPHQQQVPIQQQHQQQGPVQNHPQYYQHQQYDQCYQMAPPQQQMVHDQQVHYHQNVHSSQQMEQIAQYPSSDNVVHHQQQQQQFQQYPQHFEQSNIQQQTTEYQNYGYQQQNDNVQCGTSQQQHHQFNASPSTSTPNLGNITTSTNCSNASIIFKKPMKKSEIGIGRIIDMKNKEQMTEKQKKELIEKVQMEWNQRRQQRLKKEGMIANFDMARDEEVLEIVGGRLSMVGNMKKYQLTIGELRRRIEGPESLNISQLNCILRKAKKKNGSEEFRRLLWEQYGIEIKTSQRSLMPPTCFTPLLEEEAQDLARDIDKVTTTKLPRDQIAEAMILKMKKENISSVKMQKMVTGFLNTLERISAVANKSVPKSAGQPEIKSGNIKLDDAMEFFSNRTHGFGTINMNTWLAQFYQTVKIVQQKVDFETIQYVHNTFPLSHTS